MARLFLTDYRANENIKGINMINTDFLEYDFKDQKFDLVLMNPPFKKQGKFMDKVTTLSTTIGYIMSATRFMDKFMAHSTVIRTFKKGEFTGVNVKVFAGIYNKDILGKFTTIREAYYTPTTFNSYKTVCDKAQGGIVSRKKFPNSVVNCLISFSGTSQKYGSKWFYAKEPIDIFDMAKEGHKWFATVECSELEASAIYEQALNLSHDIAGDGGLNFDPGYWNGFNILTGS